MTVNTNKGKEFATVKTADGKTICKNLPQTKWKKLPANVRNLLDEVHVRSAGGGEQINVQA